MKQTIVYVGMDVDDTQYHGCAFNKETGEIRGFTCRPTLKGLLDKLDKLSKHFPGCTFKLCYEATYIGYTKFRCWPLYNGYREVMRRCMSRNVL